MTLLTLLREGNPLASAARQVEILESPTLEDCPKFRQMLAQHDCNPLMAEGIEILQVNVGKVCNQTCRHCHVDAGPDRRESMSREVAEACLKVLAEGNISTLDITGGAPEMNPHFRYLVAKARALGRHVIDRCNLTILMAPRFEDLAEFLAMQQVEIIASLPCYLESNCDRQRGDGVFRSSIEALQRLNSLGYGKPDSDLRLNLVFNPIGPNLPPSQATLEEAYRRELKSRYGIEFSQLFAITNLPISRFLDDLLRSGQYESYMRNLIRAFNPHTVEGVMCRTMLSVDWEGRLYDCDFNQMLELGVAAGLPSNIRDLTAAFLAQLARRPIVTGRHCFGCTAGTGSSCQGSLTE